MNKRWCEGLDWIRVEDLMEIAPEVYVKLLTQYMDVLLEMYGEERYRAFHDELRRRVEQFRELRDRHLEAGIEWHDDQIDCVVEAVRRHAEGAKEDCVRLEHLMKRSHLRVVK